MGWENREGQGNYYCRSRKVRGRVSREYVGNGIIGQIAAAYDAQKRGQQVAMEPLVEAFRTLLVTRIPPFLREKVQPAREEIDLMVMLNGMILLTYYAFQKFMDRGGQEEEKALRCIGPFLRLVSFKSRILGSLCVPVRDKMDSAAEIRAALEEVMRQSLAGEVPSNDPPAQDTK